MDLVVADTGPLNYLIETGVVHVLAHIFDTVIIPETVRDELAAPGAPLAVRKWIEAPPEWSRVEKCKSLGLAGNLDAGEAEAIAIALDINAKMVLMDDGDGRAVAAKSGLIAVGTLGVLEKADAKKLLHYEEAVERLRRTNFRASERLYMMSAERVGLQRGKAIQ